MNLTRFLFAGCLVIVLLVTSGCTDLSPHGGAAPSAPLSTTSANGTVERVEMYHFHGDHQCASCIAVGDLAEKTVNENFKDELASGRLVFAHVNYDLPENAALATKYNVTGSSLWIGIYDNNGFHKQQNMDVWYLTDDKEAYEVYLSGIISRRLNGDLS
ncbi:MAG TPA: nitrophenyl compound nitroreductase subunit ArsF family protein [Methanoregula sp.]|nr:nitrophenyl compound nitroreductase subunit ArsF family protein [Methanoregula sp.]